MSAWMRSNVLGLVAIFIALGGTAVAASVQKNTVTSKSIRNGAVTSKDVKDNDLTTADINESTLSGIQGPRGETGPQGPQGPSGTAGDAGGDLSGPYSNLSIVNNALGSLEGSADEDEIRDGSIETFDIANGQVGNADLAAGAVGTSEHGTIPAVHATRTTDQTISGTVGFEDVLFDAERYDTASMHDNTTNNSSLVAPVTGIYNITGRVTWQPSTDTARRDISLRVNDSFAIALDQVHGNGVGGASPLSQTTTTQYRLNAGDYVTLRVDQLTGGDLAVSQLNNHSPELSMTWLAPG